MIDELRALGLALATPADETDLQDAYQAARGALDGAGLRLPPRGSPDLQAAVEAEHGKARALAAALDGDTSGADEAVQAALADREAGAVRALRTALTAGDPDAIGRARRLAPAVRELRDNIATGPMRAVPVAKVAGKRPDRLLSLVGRNGALGREVARRLAEQRIFHASYATRVAPNLAIQRVSRTGGRRFLHASAPFGARFGHFRSLNRALLTTVSAPTSGVQGRLQALQGLRSSRGAAIRHPPPVARASESPQN